MPRDNQILVGVIGAAHGIRGEVRVKSFTGDPAAIAAYGPLATEDGRRTLEVLSFRPLKDDMGVIRLKGVEDRTAAEALTNLRLFIDRERLPAPDDDEFYHADLIGLRAETTSGVALGHVIALQNFGAGDLVEIAPPHGETLLVPFTKVFVPEVDMAGGRIVVAEEAIAAEGDEADPELDPDG